MLAGCGSTPDERGGACQVPPSLWLLGWVLTGPVAGEPVEPFSALGFRANASTDAGMMIGSWCPLTLKGRVSMPINAPLCLSRTGAPSMPGSAARSASSSATPFPAACASGRQPICIPVCLFHSARGRQTCLVYTISHVYACATSCATNIETHLKQVNSGGWYNKGGGERRSLRARSDLKTWQNQAPLHRLASSAQIEWM